MPVNPSSSLRPTSRRNKWQKRAARIITDSLIATAIYGASYWSQAATTTVIWDSNAGTAGVLDGSSSTDWGTGSAVANWWTGSTNVTWTDSTALNPVIAQFGNNNGTGTKNVTVSGTVTVAGLSFGTLSGTISASNPAYVLSGGTINIAGDGVNPGTITLAENSTSATPFLLLNSTLAGNNVIIQRAAGGTTEQYLQLGGSNTWTGKLTLASGNGSIFIRATTSTSLNTLTTVEVNSTTTMSLQGAGQTYTSNYSVVGTGGGTNPRGAMRFDNDMTLSGASSADGLTAITLAGNATLNFQSSTPTASNVVFTGRITESVAGSVFTKTGLGTLTLRAASNYTGNTVVGPSASGTAGGTFLLDFANSSTTDNLLYNGVTAASLVLNGAVARPVAASTATLAITGKASTTNSQTFNGLTVSGPTAINVTSGAGGAVNLSLGAITRSGAGATLALTGPASGGITTTTNVGTLLGTWTSFTSAGTTTWAGSNGSGVLGAFTGETEYSAGGNLSSLGSSANLNISSSTTGAVTQTATATINTVSMTDTSADRVVNVGSGNSLTLGTLGGVQLVTGAKNLTIGSAVDIGTLRATGATELALSNFDSTSVLTINSVIADNGANALTVVSNGSGKTVLAGTNVYTGTTLIYSGVVEARNSSALGTTAGNTSIATGAALQISGGINLGENFSTNGTGVGGTGALRNLSGSNIISGLITMAADTRISADAGSTLTIFKTNAATTLINGSGLNVSFGGAGTVVVNSQIATGTGTVTKVDSGTLILGGTNTYTGSTNINAGVVQITNAQGLGTVGGNTFVTAGAALELSSASSMTTLAEALTLNGSGVSSGGALRSVTGNNTYAGVITLASAARINSDAGTLTLDVATGSAVAGNFALTFGGAGNITLADAVATTSGITKDGSGTLTLGASDLLADGTTLGINGGTVAIGSFSDTVGAVTLTSGSITGTTGVLTGSSYAVQSGSVSAILGGSGAVTKSGSGTVTFSAANTYAGLTTISAGALRITNAQGLGTTAGATTVSSGGALELSSASSMTTLAEGLTLNGTGVNNGGALRNVAGNNTYAGAITLASATRINSDAGTLTLDVASGSAITGNFALNLGGAGNITLADAVTTTAGIIKDGSGTLTVGASDLLADTTSLTISNGTLALGTFSDTVGAVTLTNGSITGSGVLTGTGFTAQNGSISANLAGTSALFTKTGSGTVALSGTNTYTGATRFSGGRLVLDYSGGATVIPAAGAVEFGGGTLEIKGTGSALAVSVGSINSTNTGATGLSTLVVDSNVAVTGTTLARGSGTTLLVDLSAAGSSLKFSGAVATINSVVTAGGSNAWMVMKDSNGRYDYAALDGSKNIIRLNASAALPAGTSTPTVNALITANGTTTTLGANVTANTLRIDTYSNSGALDLNGKILATGLFGILLDGTNDYTITDTSVGSTGGLGNTTDAAVFFYQFGTGKLTVNAKVTATQAYFMGNGLIDWAGPANNLHTANLIYGATVRLTGTGMSLGSYDTTSTDTAGLSIGNGGILELGSSDTLVTGNFTRSLSAGGGANTFKFVADGGFSASGKDRAVNIGGASATITWSNAVGFLASGSKLILGSKYADAVVDFQNGLNLNGASQTIEVQSTNAAGIGGKVSGAITGTGASSLTKTGQGILTLSGANTYTGSTTVSEGTLLVSGSITGSTAVSVASGAELKLSGTGTVSSQTLALANTSKLSLELGSASATTISLSGAASLVGNITLGLTLTADPTDGTLFTLIDGSSAVTGGGLFSYNSTLLTEGSTFTVTSGSFSQDFVISYVGGSDNANVTIFAVPEPNSGATLAASVGLLLGLSRWRRRKSTNAKLSRPLSNARSKDDCFPVHSLPATYAGSSAAY